MDSPQNSSPAAPPPAISPLPLPPSQPIPPLKPFARLGLFSVFAILFWLTELAIQYLLLSVGDASLSFIRGSALSGATLIAAALFSSAIFKWFPRLAIHWRLRRYLGVSGFIFILFHVWGVYHFLFNYNLRAVYFSFNPLKNPLIFGTIAFPIFFVMATTSTDWAMRKLTPKIWKFIHRFVYFAFLSSIFHFLTVNPSQLWNPAGYFLLAVTAAAVFGQVFWFFKIASQKHFRTIGSIVGFSLMALAVIVGYFLWEQN